MSKHRFEFELELIEYALDIIAGRKQYATVREVCELSGLSYNGQRVSQIVWVAQQVGYQVWTNGREWEITF